MTQNLFVACGKDDSLIAKRVRLDKDAQQSVGDLFAEQESNFRKEVDEEIPFDGNWTPDKNQVLTIDVPDEAQVFQDAVTVNLPSIGSMNRANFANENIKALFTGVPMDSGYKILVQWFTTRQLLDRRFTLLSNGDTFNRVTNPAFTLDTSLTCIIEGGKIKFKSFHKLRSIIDLSAIYREATDEEVREFAVHASIGVDDPDAFVNTVDEQIRKLIHMVAKEKILDEHSAEDIQSAAAETKLTIEIRDDKIIMPTGRREIKDLLRFLNEGRYVGPISGLTYETNSRKVVQ